MTGFGGFGFEGKGRLGRRMGDLTGDDGLGATTERTKRMKSTNFNTHLLAFFF